MAIGIRILRPSLVSFCKASTAQSSRSFSPWGLAKVHGGPRRLYVKDTSMTGNAQNNTDTFRPCKKSWPRTSTACTRLDRLPWQRDGSARPPHQRLLERGSWPTAIAWSIRTSMNATPQQRTLVDPHPWGSNLANAPPKSRKEGQQSFALPPPQKKKHLKKHHKSGVTGMAN